MISLIGYGKVTTILKGKLEHDALAQGGTDMDKQTKVFLPADLVVRRNHAPIAQVEIVNKTIGAVEALTGKAVVGGWIGVEAQKTGKTIRLAPSINGTSLAHLKAEFTFQIETLGEIALVNHVNFVKAENVDSDNDLLPLLADAATIKVESVGARTTNWDTGYSLILTGVDPDEAKAILQASMRLQGEAKYDAASGYRLTTRRDVQRFCELTGNADRFNRMVAKVKTHENQHDLRGQQANCGGRLDPSKALVLTEALAA